MTLGRCRFPLSHAYRRLVIIFSRPATVLCLSVFKLNRVLMEALNLLRVHLTTSRRARVLLRQVLPSDKDTVDAKDNTPQEVLFMWL